MFSLVGVTGGLCSRVVAYPDGTPFELEGFIMTNGHFQTDGIDVWFHDPSMELPMELVPGFAQAGSTRFPYGWFVDPP